MSVHITHQTEFHEIVDDCRFRILNLDDSFPRKAFLLHDNNIVSLWLAIPSSKMIRDVNEYYVRLAHRQLSVYDPFPINEFLVVNDGCVLVVRRKNPDGNIVDSERHLEYGRDEAIVEVGRCYIT